MPYKNFSVRPLTASIGAEIGGIDLTQPLDEKIFAEIKAAVHEYMMVVFPGQDMSADAMLKLGSAFGEMEVHEVFTPMEGHPEISILLNDADHPPSNDYWHSDVTYREKPSMFTILNARELPAVGGDTLWQNSYAVFDALSESVQEMLCRHTAMHDILMAFGSTFLQQEDGVTLYRKMQDENPAQEHPVVVTHPVTGKKLLYVNPSFTSHITGLSRVESARMLDMLYEHANHPAFQVRHNWREHDLVIWDNRATQHFASGDYYPQLRRMHRITVGGDKPA